MDTILFFCKKRGLQEPIIEPIGMRSHLLIRICLDVGQEEWFGRKMVPEERESLPIEAGAEDKGKNVEGRIKNTAGERKNTEGERKNTEGEGKSIEGERKNTEDEGKNIEGERKNTEGGRKDVGGRGKDTDDRTQNAETYCGTKRGHFGLFRALVKLFDHGEQRAEKKYQKAKEQERIHLLQERQEVLSKVEEDIQKLLSDILGMIGSWEGCFCVYEDGIYRALVGRKFESSFQTMDWMPAEAGRGYKNDNCLETSNILANDMWEAILPVLWKRYFQVQEFGGYTRQLWVEELLPEAVLPHFVILGAAPCLPILIEKYAGGMKSLRWILPENDYSQEVQEFVEDFYIEYGLAIMLQITPAGQRRLQAVCTEPSNVLDFTEEANMNLAKVAKGSIWLDMLSMEEKRRRIVDRSTGITYFSLKEKWKLVRKKEPFVPEMALTPDEKVV